MALKTTNVKNVQTPTVKPAPRIQLNVLVVKTTLSCHNMVPVFTKN